MLKVGGSIITKISLLLTATTTITTFFCIRESEILWTANAVFLIMYLISKSMPEQTNYDTTEHIPPVPKPPPE